jgi:hypothetical protein
MLWYDSYSIFSFICMFCRSLFVLLYFFLLEIQVRVCIKYMSPVIEQVPIIMIYTNKTITFFNVTSRDSKGKELWPSSAVCSHIPGGRRVWRYQRDNQNPYIGFRDTKCIVHPNTIVTYFCKATLIKSVF